MVEFPSVIRTRCRAFNLLPFVFFVFLSICLLLISCVPSCHALDGAGETGSGSTSSTTNKARHVATWVQQQVGGPQPPKTCDHGLTDIGNNQLLMFGGGDDSAEQMNNDNIFILDISDPSNLTWQLISNHTSQSSPEAPSPRVGHSQYFVAPDLVVVFGGSVRDENDKGLYTNDMYTYNITNGQWKRIQPTNEEGAPLPRTFTELTPLDRNGLAFLFGGIAVIGRQFSEFDREYDDAYLFDYNTLSWRSLNGAMECLANTTTCSDAIIPEETFPDLTSFMQNVTSSLTTSRRPNEILAYLHNITANTTSWVDNAITSWTTAATMNDDTTCKTGCAEWKRADIDWPVKSEGHRATVIRDALYQFNGYSCADHGQAYQGGPECYGNTMHILNLTTSTWTIIKQPQPVDGKYASLQDEQQAMLWPHERAFATMTAYGDYIWMIMGAYNDLTGVWFYYNDVYVFNTLTRLWEDVTVKGTPPSGRWSTGAVRMGQDIWFVAGCAPPAYFNDVWTLKLETALTASNISVTFNMTSRNSTSITPTYVGKDATFSLSTRSPGKGGVAAVTSSNQYIRKTAWGDIITWGTGLASAMEVQIVSSSRSLSFDVEVGNASYSLSSTSALIKGNIQEIGGGQYQVTYTPTIGTDLAIYVYFDGVNVPGSPFQQSVIATTPVSTYTRVATGFTQTVRTRMSSLLIRTCDEYGNYLRSGGVKDAFKLVIASNLNDINITHAIDITIMDLADGSYRISYMVPDISTYYLSIYFNTQPIYGSPFIITAIDPLVVNSAMIKGFAAITIICMLVVAACMGMIWLNRHHPYIKSSSPAFLQMMLVGCLLGLGSVFTLDPVNDASCMAFPFALGSGYVLIVSSLFVKTYRIMSIFRSKSLQSRVISVPRMLSVVGLLLLIEVVLDMLFSIISPQVATTVTDPDNPILTYEKCSSRENNFIWMAITIGYKGLLLLYGVFLAVMTRNVPSQFNESRAIGLCLYNLAISVVVAFIVLLTSKQINIIYAVKCVVIIWVIMFSMLTMVVPKLVHHYQNSPLQYGRQQKSPPPGLTKEQKREWHATHNQVHSVLAMAVSGVSQLAETPNVLRSEATDDKRMGIGGRITSNWRQIQPDSNAVTRLSDCQLPATYRDATSALTSMPAVVDTTIPRQSILVSEDATSAHHEPDIAMTTTIITAAPATTTTTHPRRSSISLAVDVNVIPASMLNVPESHDTTRHDFDHTTRVSIPASVSVDSIPSSHLHSATPVSVSVPVSKRLPPLQHSPSISISQPRMLVQQLTSLEDVENDREKLLMPAMRVHLPPE